MKHAIFRFNKEVKEFDFPRSSNIVLCTCAKEEVVVNTASLQKCCQNEWGKTQWIPLTLLFSLSSLSYFIYRNESLHVD